MDDLDKIRSHLYPVESRTDRFEEHPTIEIAKIAEASRQTGIRKRKDYRAVTSAYRQLEISAAFLMEMLRPMDTNHPEATP